MDKYFGKKPRGSITTKGNAKRFVQVGRTEVPSAIGKCDHGWADEYHAAVLYVLEARALLILGLPAKVRRYILVAWKVWLEHRGCISLQSEGINFIHAGRKHISSHAG